MKVKLHLDWFDYAERLFGGGRIDWSSPAEVAALIGKAQALLPSDLVILPVGRMALALADPAALAAKPKGAQPLRTLLAEEAVRGGVFEAITMLSVPALALGLPSPGHFAVQAAERAGLSAPEIDEDLVDDASVYLADFLRRLSTLPISGLVIGDEDGIAFRDFLGPMEKVAASYGWQTSVGGPGPEYQTVAIPAGGEPEAVLAEVRALRS